MWPCPRHGRPPTLRPGPARGARLREPSGRHAPGSFTPTTRRSGRMTRPHAAGTDDGTRLDERKVAALKRLLGPAVVTQLARDERVSSARARRRASWPRGARSAPTAAAVVAGAERRWTNV